MNLKTLALASLAFFSASFCCLAQTVADAQRKAVEKCPDLAKESSPLHAKFLALHLEAKDKEPAFLKNPNWPLIVAERAFVILDPPPAAIPPRPKVKPSKADVLAALRERKVYRIEDGEVAVQGRLIQRVKIGIDPDSAMEDRRMGTSE